MATFVLVHGAWHGAWCWSRVIPTLRAARHDVFAVTLTGVGDRAHLLSREISLDTHVNDVLSLITCEELTDVVLVGHSYGGLPITGAADRLLAQRPGVLKHLVYIDAIVPHSGECWATHHDAETVARRVAESAAHPLGALPPPDAALYGLTGADCEWVNRRQLPHPFGQYREALHFDSARLATLPRTFIDCVSPAWPSIAPMRRRVRSDPGWRVREIATGHDAMVSAPEPLLQMLLETAS